MFVLRALLSVLGHIDFMTTSSVKIFMDNGVSFMLFHKVNYCVFI